MAQNNNNINKSSKTPKESGGILKDLMELTTRKKGAKVMLSRSRKGKKKVPDGSQKIDMTMKKKQKISVIKASTVEDEEKEVFENVADSNPVFSKTLIRPGKMRWKGDDKEEQETLRKKKEEESEKKVKPKASVRQKVEVKNNKSDELLLKIEKLEKENDELKKKLKDVQTVMKNRGEEPKEVVCSKCKKPPMKSSSRIVISKTLPPIIQPDMHAKVAYNVLSIMKKNQVLDAVLDFKSNKILFVFFRESTSGDKPSDEIANLVETAMTRGLKYLTNCCDQIDDVIDNDLRTFICSPTAKKVLLKTLFENPELVPDMWGGGPILIKMRKDKDDVTNNHHT